MRKFLLISIMLSMPATMFGMKRAWEKGFNETLEALKEAKDLTITITVGEEGIRTFYTVSTLDNAIVEKVIVKIGPNPDIPAEQLIYNITTYNKDGEVIARQRDPMTSKRYKKVIEEILQQIIKKMKTGKEKRFLKKAVR